MVAYLKVSANEKTYSDYLWAAREAEKEETMEPSHSQTKATSFFPLWKLKGTQPTKILAIRAVHLEEEGSEEEVGTESEDPPRCNQRCNRGIYCTPGKSSERNPEGWEVVLPL